jgi:hypothetical protein
VAHGLGVATGGCDVVENPFLVADFFLDVLGDGRRSQARRSGRRPPSDISSGVVWRTWWKAWLRKAR